LIQPVFNEPPDSIQAIIAEDHSKFGLVLVPIWMQIACEIRGETSFCIPCLHGKNLDHSILPNEMPLDPKIFTHAVLRWHLFYEGGKPLKLWIGQCSGCRRAYWTITEA
jgi:hypothetical protein